MDVEKRMAAVERLIPKTGYNVVGVDTFEEPGDDLFLIGHFATRIEAERARDEAKASDPDAMVYIYEPE